jgi:L-asparagine transporter-like permease
MSEFRMKMKNFMTLLGLAIVAVLLYGWYLGEPSALKIADTLVILIVAVMIYYSRKLPDSGV